jgi:transposase
MKWLHDRNLSYERIAKIYDTSRCTVYRRLNKDRPPSGKKCKKNFIKFTSEQIKNMKKQYEVGKTYKEIGKLFGVSGSTVTRWIMKENKCKEDDYGISC